MRNLKLRNKIALVTGSSRGIGKAIATRFAEEGASVVINASKSVDEAKAALRGLPKKDKAQKHSFICADIAIPAEIDAMMKETARKYGRLDMLINNAGSTYFIKHAQLDLLTAEIFDELYRVHLRGAFLCVQKGLPLLKRSKGPLIINIASIASITGIGSNIAYCALKAGLVNMTVSLARALAPRVRVNAISPGLIETVLSKKWKTYNAEQLKKTPLGRLGTCRDIANAAISLAASLGYITGQNIVVDGGRAL